MEPIEVFIFSYNRGDFLLNCVESTKRNFSSASITVIDDRSDDEYTKAVLKSFSDVTVKYATGENDGRWGGFYKNIDWVIQDLATHSWVILIEDDMQFVRPFTDADIEAITNFFDRYPKSGYLMLEFLKDEHKLKDQKFIMLDKHKQFYFFEDGAESYRGTVHACTSGVLNIRHMRECNYRFVGDRKTVRNRAKSTFTKMGVYPYPNLMYLPFPKAIKNRKQTVTRRVIERYYGADFNPYFDLAGKRLNFFLERNISQLPYAGDWLKCKKPKIKSPFLFGDSIKRAPKIFQFLENGEIWVRKFSE